MQPFIFFIFINTGKWELNFVSFASCCCWPKRNSLDKPNRAEPSSHRIILFLNKTNEMILFFSWLAPDNDVSHIFKANFFKKFKIVAPVESGFGKFTLTSLPNPTRSFPIKINVCRLTYWLTDKSSLQSDEQWTCVNLCRVLLVYNGV